MTHHPHWLVWMGPVSLANFVSLSAFSPTLNLIGVALPVFFRFIIAIYVVHGILQDIGNQFETPHVLGSIKLPPAVFHTPIIPLILGEIGGFGIIFAGYLKTLI